MKRQYGVQVIWKDPKRAGVPDGEESRWAAFDTLDQADRFAASYVSTLGEMAERMPWLAQTPGFDPAERWKDSSVRDVMRAERWAVEEYTPWGVTG